MRFLQPFFLFPILCLLLVQPEASATTWAVGPTRLYKVPSAVASLVADGDTVDIDAGLYLGDVAKWFANDLLLRGVGNGYAHLEADGNNAEGKAIWVIKGNNCTVEGLEFSGCQVPDHNGAGIRQEGLNLTLRHCSFHHNEMGILTSNDGVSDYLFESCEFSENGYGDGYSHNVYVGHVNSLTMRFCYSHDAKTGHLVKSRAKHNALYYNRLTGEAGDGSYEIDLPNGGSALLVGNIIEQSPNSQNGGIISFGLEGASNPDQVLVLSHNTIWNRRFDGRFVQFSDQTDTVKMVNNLLAGPGTPLQGLSASLDTTHNIRLLDIADAQLTDPDHYDFRPKASSLCVDAGIAAGQFDGQALSATFQYVHPLASEARSVTGLLPDAGAYEAAGVSGTTTVEAQLAGLEIFPNPVFGDVVTIRFQKPLMRDTWLRLFNSQGKLVASMPVAFNRKSIELPLGNYPSGLYRIEAEGLGSGRLIRL